MSKISIYEVVPVPKLADKLVGTSVGGEPEDLTYNFTLGELLNLFIPNIPGNTLQGVLDFGNTATQNINLTGIITTTTLNVGSTANILNSYLTGETHITGGLYDRLNSVGTAGQVLRSTGTKVEWYSIPNVIPTLQQVLASGNTADINIILSSNIQALTATANNVVSNTSFSVNGTLKDKDASVGTSGQILSSTGTKVQWIDLPVYTATSPLNINSSTRVISIQQANASQSGYLSSLDWINFDGKQNAGNYIVSLIGEATGIGPGAATVTLNTAAVTGKLLTGLNLSAGGNISATDSILVAFGKVQNQISSTLSGVVYKGVWNAATNSPTLSSSVGVQGWYYVVNVAGNTDLNGITDWQVGDWAIFNGTVWNKVDNTDSVTSVNGQVGAVSLTTDNIPEGATNLYFLNSRARAALSFVAGSGAYNNTTGVITIPTDNSQILNGANYITLASLSASSPLSYNNLTGAFAIQVANTTQNGYLSSADWNTFNGKQNYLNGTGLVKSVAGTISYITDNSANWNTAYNDSIVSAAVTGTATKTLTLNQQDGGTIQASWSDADTGLTSVGLTMPSAFSVANSPLTSNGTIGVTGAGTTAQYIRGDGSLATFPTIATEAQRLITEVYNETGATLTKGTVVYINGGHGNLPTITKAIATGDATSAQTYGIVQTDITNNNNGYVVVIGSLTDLDTQAYANGTQLYLSSTVAGQWTSVKQYAPAHLVYVAIVTRSHPTQGVVEVRIQNGFEMDELHNVSAQSPANGSILQYVTSTGLWTAVAGTTTNIAEGTNLYFTNARAIASTLTGYTSGAGTITSSDSVLSAIQKLNGNIAGLTTGVSSVFGRTGAVVATEGDYSLTQLSDVTITSPTTNQVLKYNGTAWVNDTDANTGTVTSVGLSAPTGFSVTGSPVTSSGTLALAFASGYSLPTTVKQSNWDDAYTFVAAFPTQTGNSGKYLTTDGSVLSWATNPLGTVTSVGLSSATSGVTIGSSPITTSGTITLAIATATTSQNGLLSSTDWTTFNSKQAELNGTGFVKASGTTISYDNSTYLTTSSAASTYLPLTGGTLTGELAIKTNTNTGLNIISSTGTQSLWVRAGYDTDGTATPIVSANNIQFQSSGSAAGSFSFVVGNAKALFIDSNSAATFSLSVTATSFVKTSGTSSQFLKADGSVDSTTYQGALTLTTTGTSGAATLVGNTLNIPQYSGGGGMAIGDSITSATAGSVLFAGASGVLAQDNANFFWDDTNNRLGLLTATPSCTIDIPSNNTSNYQFRSGTFQIQSYGINNGFMSDNMYYNGTSWTRTTTGYGMGFQFSSGQVFFHGANTGTGNFTQNLKFKFEYTGAFAIGDNISSTLGVYTGATLLYNTSGNLGIGTITIGSKLQVNGNAAIGYSASTAAPTNGLLVAGRVGINATIASWAAAFSTLQLGTRTVLWNADANQSSYGNNIYYDGGAYRYVATAGASYHEQFNGSHNWYYAPSGTAGAAFTPTLGMTMSNTGTLGINTSTVGSRVQINGNAAIGYSASTAAPTNGLAVAGQSSFGTNAFTTTYNASFGTILLQSYGVNNAWFGDNVYYNGTNFIRLAAGYAGMFYFQGSEGQFRFGTTGAAGGSIGTGTVTLKTALDNSFAVGNLSTISGVYTGATFLVNSSGSVGIGTITIGSKLQVNGNAAIGYSASTAAPSNGLQVSGSVFIGTSDDGGKLVSYSTTAASQIKAAGTAPAITFSNTVLSPTIGGVLGVCTAASQFFTGTASSDMVLANQFSAGDLIFGTNNLARMRVKASGVINITSIPTTSVGLVAGDIYSNAGILTIV